MSPVEGRLDEIEDMISVLANDATTGKSRKVKAEQRGVFKEFQATFEVGNVAGVFYAWYIYYDIVYMIYSM